MLSKSSTPRRILRKERNSRKRTLHFPLDENGIILRRHRCAKALADAAQAVIEGQITRQMALEDFDNLMVTVAMEQLRGDVHLAALLLNVPDTFVRARWNGLKS